MTRLQKAKLDKASNWVLLGMLQPMMAGGFLLAGDRQFSEDSGVGTFLIFGVAFAALSILI